MLKEVPGVLPGRRPRPGCRRIPGVRGGFAGFCRLGTTSLSDATLVHSACVDRTSVEGARRALNNRPVNSSPWRHLCAAHLVTVIAVLLALLAVLPDVRRNRLRTDSARSSGTSHRRGSREARLPFRGRLREAGAHSRVSDLERHRPDWTEETPTSSMRRAQYRIRARAVRPNAWCSTSGPGQGGDAQANAARWASPVSPGRRRSWGTHSRRAKSRWGTSAWVLGGGRGHPRRRMGSGHDRAGAAQLPCYWAPLPGARTQTGFPGDGTSCDAQRSSGRPI